MARIISHTDNSASASAKILRPPKPIKLPADASKAMTAAEVRYAQIEKELLTTTISYNGILIVEFVPTSNLLSKGIGAICSEE